jgi:hypothetical protein
MKRVSSPREVMFLLSDLGIKTTETVIVGLNGKQEIVSVQVVDDVKMPGATIDKDSLVSAISDLTFNFFVVLRGSAAEPYDNMLSVLAKTDSICLDVMVVDWDEQIGWSAMCDDEDCCSPENPIRFDAEYMSGIPFISTVVDNNNDDDDDEDDDDYSVSVPMDLDTLLKTLKGLSV